MRVFATVFMVVGVGLLAGAFYAYQQVRQFVQTAVTANGVVTANVRAHHHRGDNFYPRIRFRTTDGQDVSFVSNVGTRPAMYRVGEPVTVIYDAHDPYHASIRSVFSVWLLPMILATLGVLFSSVGGITAAVMIAGARKNAWLERNGLRIQAQLTNVVLNRSVRVNGEHPYRILCQWLDPMTNQVRVFESANIWFDPAAYITAKTLDVLIDRDRPNRYMVDTAFLPKAGR
jgi:hypothetical protein